jgi:hypothetical protein
MPIFKRGLYEKGTVGYSLTLDKINEWTKRAVVAL